MGSPMGFFFSRASWKKKNRWKITIPGYVDSESLSANVLPPLKAGRPSISPGKPEWGTLDITLYDLRCNQNPLFNWLKRIYDPQLGVYGYLVNPSSVNTLTTTTLPAAGTTQAVSGGFKVSQAQLELLDGCGNVVEQWVYEGVWPQKIDWGELDMGSSDVITADVSLRYDRAWCVQS
jgi:hypothetical protein